MENYSSLALAYLGDAVFELYTRTEVLKQGKASVNKLHSRSKSLVNAGAQALMYHKIYECLTDEERAVLKRGRNANPHHGAKSASINDYRHATGLEALFGYLFLQERHERIVTLFKICIEQASTEEAATKEGDTQ